MQVVCVTGMPGCGKDEVLAVAADLGFSIVRMGDVVRAQAAQRRLPITDSGVGGMAHEERQKHGLAIWAERTVPLVRGDRVLIDGLRGIAELDVFRKAFGNLTVIAVHASPKTRHERMMRRKRADDAATLDAFRARDLRELSWGLGDVIATADIVLVNEGSLEDFRGRAREALERLHD